MQFWFHFCSQTLNITCTVAKILTHCHHWFLSRFNDPMLCDKPNITDILLFPLLQALIYPLTVASKSNSPARHAAANKILKNMREHSNLLVQQAILVRHMGLYSLSGKTSYRQISWSLETARLDVIMIVSLWNLAGVSSEPIVVSVLTHVCVSQPQWLKQSWAHQFI